MMNKEKLLESVVKLLVIIAVIGVGKILVIGILYLEQFIFKMSSL